MANKILPVFSTEGTVDIDIAGLSSSTSNVGNQSTMIDNSVTRYKRIRLFIKIKQGTNPTGSKGVYIYALRGDQNGTPYRTDGAAATKAGTFTVVNAELIGVLGNLASPSTGDILYKELILEDPGVEWGIAITHDTGVTLDGTAGSHYVRYIGESPEVQ